MKDYSNYPRGSGKTTRLVYISEYTGHPVLVADERCKSYIKLLADKLNLTIPEPVTAAELFGARSEVRSYKNILVDDSINVLISLLKVRGVEVDAIC